MRGARPAKLVLVEALALAGRLDEAKAVGERLLEQIGDEQPAAATVHLELARAAVAATRWSTAVRHLDATTALLAAHPDPGLTEQAGVLEAEIALAGDEVEAARRSGRGGDATRG